MIQITPESLIMSPEVKRSIRMFVKEVIKEVVEECNATTIAPQRKEDEILDVKGAAELLKLKPSTIYKLIGEAKLPFSRPNGKTLMFFRFELIQWVKSHNVKPLPRLIEDAEMTMIESNKRKGSK